MYELGFDCANKSLAYCLRRVPDPVRDGCCGGRCSDHADDELHPIEMYKFEILSCDVIDINPGYKTTDVNAIYRMKCLRRVLGSIILPDDFNTDTAQIYIEYQMGPNKQSGSIFDGICMYYGEYTIYSVGPSFKNKLAITKELSYCYFIEKTFSAYKANKQHAEANFLYYADQTGLDISHIPKKRYPDIADAMLQMWAYHVFKKKKEDSVPEHLKMFKEKARKSKS
jgi:hypothetical protein